ncbi:MAG: hypothetical protein JO006_04360 [Paucibacter sp.]|nr:hypothetical protein [Roseateles sp.]
MNKTRRRIARVSFARRRALVTALCLKWRGQRPERTAEQLRPMLRGWMGFLQHVQGRRAIDEMDAWLRRRQRVIVWRPQKRPSVRANQAGERPVWTRLVRGSRASTRAARLGMHRRATRRQSPAVPPPCRPDVLTSKRLANMGLVSLVDLHQRLQRSLNRRMRTRTSGGVRGLRG